MKMSAPQEPNIPAPGRPKLRPLIPKPFINAYSTPPTPTPYGYGGRSELLVSTRWTPTTEQLQALEEMYRHGIRTPSAEQIQQITAKLRGFGKIEGKNVFYWFQNHKARDRQRKRRQMEFLAAGDKRQSGAAGRRYLESENHKDLPTPTTTSVDNWRQRYCKELQRSESRWCCPFEVLSSCIQAEGHAQENGTSEFTLISGNGNGNGNGKNPTLDLFPVKDHDMQQQQQEKSFCNASNKPNRFFEFLPIKNY